MTSHDFCIKYLTLSNEYGINIEINILNRYINAGNIKIKHFLPRLVPK